MNNSMAKKKRSNYLLINWPTCQLKLKILKNRPRLISNNSQFSFRKQELREFLFNLIISILKSSKQNKVKQKLFWQKRLKSWSDQTWAWTLKTPNSFYSSKNLVRYVRFQIDCGSTQKPNSSQCQNWRLKKVLNFCKNLSLFSFSRREIWSETWKP